MKQCTYITWCLAAGISIVTAPAFAAQIVTPTESLIFANPQTSIPYTLMYRVSSPDSETSTGLGIRVHYNSTALELTDQTPYTSQLQPLGLLSDDTQDYDADPTTDKYWILSWIDFAATWPGLGKTPTTLLSSHFKTKADFSGATTLRLTASATAQNTLFESSALTICAKPIVSVIALDATAREGSTDTGSFQIKLANPLPAACGNLNINYQVTGTATAGNDYLALSGSATINAGSQQTDLIVNALADSLTESAESVNVALQAASNYQLASNNNATVTIQDVNSATLPSVLITSSKLQLIEGQDTTVNLTISRQTTDSSQALTVYLQATGTATVGSDYAALPSSVVIPAGQAKANLALTLLNDSAQEPNETLKISLQANSNYQLADLSAVNLTVIDDELNNNTSLQWDQAGSTKPNAIPTLSSVALVLLSLGLILLVAVYRPHLNEKQV